MVKTHNPIFNDRGSAGEQLAARIAELQPIHPIVYAIPRGGLVVAVPVAKRLQCPLDVAIAKKITLPENPELALGAITPDGDTLFLNHTHALQCERWSQVMKQAQAKAAEYRHALQPFRPKLEGQTTTAIIVDDGIATGATIAVIAMALRQQSYQSIWIAAPVVPADMLPTLSNYADKVIVLAAPKFFSSVGSFYKLFPQITMAEAKSCLQEMQLNRLKTDVTEQPD